MRKKFAKRFVTMALVAMALTLAAVSVANAQSTGTISACAHLKKEVIRVCVAYLGNDSGALLDFYRKAHSADASEAGKSLEKFHYRYRGQARRLIEARVAKWPQGRAVAGLYSITITDASSTGTTARLTTKETWNVSGSEGKPLYAEPGKIHHITMAKVPGNYTDIWVVTKIA